MTTDTAADLWSQVCFGGKTSTLFGASTVPFQQAHLDAINGAAAELTAARAQREAAKAQHDAAQTAHDAAEAKLQNALDLLVPLLNEGDIRTLGPAVTGVTKRDGKVHCVVIPGFLDSDSTAPQ